MDRAWSGGRRAGCTGAARGGRSRGCRDDGSGLRPGRERWEKRERDSLVGERREEGGGWEREPGVAAARVSRGGGRLGNGPSGPIRPARLD